ncbi:MAG: MFS transporter [Deinococcota bacterium]
MSRQPQASVWSRTVARVTPSNINLQQVFWGWWIVAAGIGLQMLVIGLMMQAYGAYVPILQESFGWSKTTLSTVYSLQRLQSGLVAPFQGVLLTRFGAKRMISIGVVIFASGFWGLSYIDTLTEFIVMFLVLGLGAAFTGFLSVTTTVVNWFERRRASALSLVSVGMSVGGLLVPSIAWLLATQGWRVTARVSGLLVLIIGLPLAQLMRTRPEMYGLRPDGEPARDEASKDTTSQNAQTASKTASKFEISGLSVAQALRTRAFWFISLGHASAVSVVSAVSVHTVSHLQAGLGYSLPRAASVVALMTSLSLVGQLLGGYLGDSFNKRFIATGAMISHAIAIVALAYADSFIWVLMFAVMHGLAWGMRAPLMGALRADYFGRRAFAKIMGYSIPIVTIGMMGGPVVAGYFADVSGDYALGFSVLAGVALVGSLFFVFAGKAQSELG